MQAYFSGTQAVITIKSSSSRYVVRNEIKDYTIPCEESRVSTNSYLCWAAKTWPRFYSMTALVAALSSCHH